MVRSDETTDLASAGHVDVAPDPPRVAIARRTERWLGALRISASFWAIGMVATYPTYPYPWLPTLGIGLVVVFLVVSAVLLTIMERDGYRTWVRRAAFVGLALDTAAVTALSFLYGFDQDTSVWILLFLLPVEGSMRYQLRGAAWTLGLGVLTYLGRAVAWNAWIGTELELRSVAFRMTVVAIVAVLVAMISEELRSQRERVSRTLEEVHRSERWRSRLVSALAHDVRSPLATIQMQAQMLESGKLPPDLAVDIVRGIARQADRLQRLAEGLLDMARSEEAALELHARPVVVEELLARCVEGSRTDASITAEPGLVATLDPDRIEQVLTNLLTNAARYGDPPFIVEGRASKAGLVLEVRDHGPGIPEAERARLFRAFAASDREGSVGLGLWIVHELVRAHGGTIVVQDAEPGALFRILLPVPVSTGVRQDESAALPVRT